MLVLVLVPKPLRLRLPRPTASKFGLIHLVTSTHCPTIAG